MLAATSFIFAAGLTALAFAQGPLGLFVAWAILGVAMAAELDAAVRVCNASIARITGRARCADSAGNHGHRA